MLLGYTVAKAPASPRNLTWFTRPFLLVRGWGLGTRLRVYVPHSKLYVLQVGTLSKFKLYHKSLTRRLKFHNQLDFVTHAHRALTAACFNIELFSVFSVGYCVNRKDSLTSTKNQKCLRFRVDARKPAGVPCVSSPVSVSSLQCGLDLICICSHSQTQPHSYSHLPVCITPHSSLIPRPPNLIPKPPSLIPRPPTLVPRPPSLVPRPPFNLEGGVWVNKVVWYNLIG